MGKYGILRRHTENSSKELQMGGEDEKESALTFVVKKGWNWNKMPLIWIKLFVNKQLNLSQNVM